MQLLNFLVEESHTTGAGGLNLPILLGNVVEAKNIEGDKQSIRNSLRLTIHSKKPRHTPQHPIPDSSPLRNIPLIC